MPAPVADADHAQMNAVIGAENTLVTDGGESDRAAKKVTSSERHVLIRAKANGESQRMVKGERQESKYKAKAKGKRQKAKGRMLRGFVG
jgi:hypothetical protein